MKKQTLEIVITAALAVVLIALTVNAVTRTGRGKRPAVPVETAGISSPAPAKFSLTPIKPLDERIDRQRERERLGWKRNPFAAAERKPAELVVNGIVFDTRNPGETYCLLGGEVVKPGDRVNGVEVVEIRIDAVTLRKDGKTIVIPFSRDDQ